MPSRRTWPLLLGTAWLVGGLPARAGEFDRIEGDRLETIAKGGEARRRDRLTAAEIESLPQALRDARSAFLVVKTGRGNYARLLVSSALRKPPDGAGGVPIPVLLLDRFDTFEPGRNASRVARGAGVILFDGFQLDLDSGQVVPDGQGGDLAFSAGGPALAAVGGAAIYTPLKAIAPDAARPGPPPGKAVIPTDFAGRYRLAADGRWSGLLELQVGDDRAVTGRLRSEANGTSYEVKGEVAAETPRKLVFTVKFPRTEQTYEGYLFTEGKNAMAGTFTTQDRTFGFYAVREGER